MATMKTWAVAPPPPNLQGLRVALAFQLEGRQMLFFICCVYIASFIRYVLNVRRIICQLCIFVSLVVVWWSMFLLSSAFSPQSLFFFCCIDSSSIWNAIEGCSLIQWNPSLNFSSSTFPPSPAWLLIKRCWWMTGARRMHQSLRFCRMGLLEIDVE